MGGVGVVWGGGGGGGGGGVGGWGGGGDIDREVVNNDAHKHC